MTVVTYMLLCLIGLKLAWNLGVPVEMARRRLKRDGSEKSGISFMPALEIVLLLLATGTAALSKGQGWTDSPRNIVTWGGLAIVATYALCFLLGMILGWILSRKEQGGA